MKRQLTGWRKGRELESSFKRPYGGKAVIDLGKIRVGEDD